MSRCAQNLKCYVSGIDFNSLISFSRSDELYNFFQLWAPDIYGELQEEEIFSKGFILVEEDTELWDEEENEEGEIGDSIGGELKDMTKESWEVRLETKHAEAGQGVCF